MRPSRFVLAALLFAGTAHANETEEQPSIEAAASSEAAAPADKPKPVLRRHVQPRWPNAAKQAGYEHEVCKVIVSVSAKGRATDTEVDACPAIFHDAVSRAVMKWRWEPLFRDGEPISYKTRYTLTFASQPR